LRGEIFDHFACHRWTNVLIARNCSGCATAPRHPDQTDREKRSGFAETSSCEADVALRVSVASGVPGLIVRQDRSFGFSSLLAHAVYLKEMSPSLGLWPSSPMTTS